ncbi:hypothetical protein CLV62_13721 [Dysgonomonas alginatilytica]|uniref:Uncharacterized protein n=1 Tax=Dysgonomonas alginatilytica TaxID=1605892 RepID=A0A2V3PIB8_9BACT|nr:hypothetical protein CLV62_13721 [Dysgonomonas alginatilytica]
MKKLKLEEINPKELIGGFKIDLIYCRMNIPPMDQMMLF